MCYYDYIRFACGCKTWGELRKPCSRAGDKDKQPGVSACTLRRVHKHIYPSNGKLCLKCRDENEPDLAQQLSQLQSLTPGLMIRRPARHQCDTPGCYLLARHFPPHQFWDACPVGTCKLEMNHEGEHSGPLFTVSTDQAVRFERSVLVFASMIRQLNLQVLNSMSIRDSMPKSEQKPPSTGNQQSIVRQFFEARKRVRDAPQQDGEPASFHEEHCYPYLPLSRNEKQIRLFLLYPEMEEVRAHGTFLEFSLADHPNYTALSYTWGDPIEHHDLVIALGDSHKILRIRRNLWSFLQQQRSVITQPKYFWIDAICINQSDVSERNHQVGLMKGIYVKAEDVYIWLGQEQDDSDVAMDYLSRKGTRELRPRGPGYFPIWTREEGYALVHLCDRPYWHRMWIIQEIVHAEKITLWCGSKRVDWAIIEQLYLKLKTLEDEAWWAHHEHAIGVLQSAAAVMAWQRAHWRHAKTSTPTLRTLIEVFRHWKCGDIRDKVFALVNMASKRTAITPDYSMTPRDIYHAVRDKHPWYNEDFDNLLSQVLGLSHRDIQFDGRYLVDYNIYAPETMMLRKRMDDDW